MESENISTSKTEANEAEQWFYMDGNDRMGPYSKLHFEEICKERSISPETLIWHTGLENWIRVSTSKLAFLFPTPPPIKGDLVNNSIVWVLAFAPMIGLILQNIVAGILDKNISGLISITIGLNISLCILDEKRLEKLGHDTASLGWSFLVPVYLFIRAKKLSQKPTYAIIWCVTFIAITIFPSYILDSAIFINSNQQTIEVVKDGSFESYPNFTVGEAIKKHVDDVKWTSFRGTDKANYVNVEGDAVNSEGNRVHVLIQFTVNNDRTFSVEAMTFDNEPQDIVTINEFISHLY